MGGVPDTSLLDDRRAGITAWGVELAGVHIADWRICLVGIVLAVGAPAIAWLEQSALLILLVLVVMAAVIAPFVWRNKRGNEHRPLPSR